MFNHEVKRMKWRNGFINGKEQGRKEREREITEVLKSWHCSNGRCDCGGIGDGECFTSMRLIALIKGEK